MTYVHPRQTYRIAGFLLRKWRPCRPWPFASLLAWVQWFVDHDRCLLVSDSGRIVTVALFRCVDDPKDVLVNYRDTGGDVAYIDVCASDAPGAMKAAFNLLLAKVGATATRLAWIRGKCRDRFTIVPLKAATRHLIYV